MASKLSNTHYLMQGFFFGVFWATEDSGLSETLSFWTNLALSFIKIVDFSANFSFFPPKKWYILLPIFFGRWFWKVVRYFLGWIQGFSVPKEETISLRKWQQQPRIFFTAIKSQSKNPFPSRTRIREIPSVPIPK